MAARAGADALASAPLPTILSRSFKELAMCYLVREPAEEPRFTTTTPASPRPERVRPRWAGALAFMLVGGLALAALVAPSPTAKLPDIQQPAAAPVVKQAAGIERTSLPMDDGVPTAPTKDVVGAGMRPCEHGL